MRHPDRRLSAAKDKKSVDDGGEPHGDRTEKHRQNRIPNNLARLIEEKDPTRRVDDSENREQQDVEEPKASREIIHARNWERHLV